MKMSIATVVSFVGSSRKGLKIVMVRTDGSTVTLTSMGSVSRGGMSFTPSPVLRRMLESSGKKATEAKKENGNEHGKA
jgi:hypothetical protein